MFLVSFVLAMAVSGSFSDRGKLDEALNNMERIIRYASDEATLRSRIIRLTFELPELGGLNEGEQKVKLEYSNENDLVLQKDFFVDESKLSPSELEDYQKRVKEFTSKFTEISDIDRSLLEVPPNVKLLALGSHYFETLLLEGKPSLYFYPGGERDHGIIIFATYEELASLEVEPFTRDIKRNYFKINEQAEDEELNLVQETLAQSIYEDFFKK